MTKTVEFYYDFGSPASYLAYKKLRELARKKKININYKPILLGGVFKAVGNQAPANIPAKGRYLFMDLKRYAKRYGVDFEFNPHFPIHTLNLMRLAIGMIQNKDFLLLNDILFESIWRDQLDMNSPVVIQEVLEKNRNGL